MLDNLPAEILEMILNQDCLNFPDLINISSTCSLLQSFVLNNNNLWRSYYRKRWFEIAERSPKIDNYFAEVSYIYKVHHEIDGILTRLTSLCMHKELLLPADFAPFIHMIKSRCLNAEYLVHYLREILKDPSEIKTYDVVPLNTPGNLTIKYYSLETLYYLGLENFKVLWEKFISLDEDDRILEIGAALLMKWSKPQFNIKVGNVHKEFDGIAEKVKNCLRINHPRHPLLKTNQDDSKLWRNKIIKENKFSLINSQQILSTITQVMSQNALDKDNDPNSFTLEMFELKPGFKITRLVIFEGVARRLGVKLDWVNAPGGFLLRFIQLDNSERKIYYVDVSNGGKLILATHGLITNPNSILDSESVLKRIINDLAQSLHQDESLTPSILELNLRTHPTNLQAMFAFSAFYRRYNIEILPATNLRYLHRNPFTSTGSHVFTYFRHDGFPPHGMYPINPPKSPSTRNGNVKFAVGMVMKHKLYNYACVIYGWDNTCDRKAPWQQEITYEQFKLGQPQPFYKVLLEDGSKKYVAQGNLLQCGLKGGFEKTLKLGKYFTHFFKNQFVPNYFLHEKYPYDVEVRKKFQLLG
nr:F-box only protein 21-like [Onthophagus taurus]